MLLVTPGDIVTTQLDVFITDSNGFAIDPYHLGYGIFINQGSEHVLVSGSNDLPPQQDAVGHYYPSWQVPNDALLGTYRIIWLMQETDVSPVDQIVQDFAIGSADAMPDVYQPRVRGMITWVRTLLRDNNPDRNYHFRPPAHEHMRDGMTHHFGYIWEDAELYIFLEMSVGALNHAPPQSNATLPSLVDKFRYPVAVGAAAMAITAVALNWVADEFDYSIGGKSLNLEKSSKYQSMAQQFEEKYRETIEQKKSIRHVSGLAQVPAGFTVLGGGGTSRISASALRHAVSYVSPWL